MQSQIGTVDKKLTTTKKISKKVRNIITPDEMKKRGLRKEVKKLRKERDALAVFCGLEPAPPEQQGRIFCRMCNALYITSDGQMPCYCSKGRTRILGRIEGKNIMEFYYGLTMRTLRANIALEQLPFPECVKCEVKTFSPSAAPDILPERMPLIHFEPSSACNLKCPDCPTHKLSRSKTRAFYPYEEFKEMIDAINIPVLGFGFCGFGEPLLNIDVPKMIYYVKQKLTSPIPYISIDTNANIRNIDPKELVESGVDQINFSIDGAFQENYEKFRKGGNLKLALDFMSKVVSEKERKVKSRLKLIWKYTLFEHVDSLEEIEKAIKLAGQIGVSFNHMHRIGETTGICKSKKELNEFIHEKAQKYSVEICGPSPKNFNNR